MTMIESRVSIVVASYNHREFLEQRIQSLLSQSYTDFEIIIIDDASTDSSPEVLRRFENHPKVQILELMENMGWVKVSNLGADMASGEFIIFGNCDDYSDPNQVTELVKAMGEYPTAGLAFSRSNIVDNQGLLLGNDYETRGVRFRRKCRFDTLISKELMTSYLFHSIVIPNLSAAIFRKSVFNEVGKFSEEIEIAADWEIFFRIAERYDVAYLAESLNNFRSHDESIRSHTKVRAMQSDIARLLLNRIKVSASSFVKRMFYRHRLIYLLILVLRKPTKSDLSDCVFLLNFACKYDPLCIPVLPVAIMSRVARIPVGVVARFYGAFSKYLKQK